VRRHACPPYNSTIFLPHYPATSPPHYPTTSPLSISALPICHPGTRFQKRILLFIPSLPREEFMPEQMLSVPDELTHRNDRKERRAFVRYPCKQTTTCSLFPSYECFVAQIQDLSTRGIGMVLARAFRPDSLLIIELTHGDPTSCLAVPSRVTQCTKLGGAHWSICCEFDRPLSSRTLRAILRPELPSTHRPGRRLD